MQTDILSQNIKKRFDHAQAKLVLKETYSAKMVFAFNGGMWQADPLLITQCNLCLANGHFEPVLEDFYGNPVKVDAEELKILALERWQEQMNAWLVEYNNIAKQR
jgi:hypothetical protein